MKKIPVTNKILEEIPRGISPREYSQLEVGWTKLGLQVWCKRHELNVMHVDFQGAKHPASMETGGSND